jgi:ABC-type phosphate transport system substrate-binding protein
VIRLIGRSLLLLASLALALPVMGQTQLNGAGATFPYPMYSKWFSEYNKLHPDVQINYQSIGSGGGIRQVLNGTVDFGASDGPMTDEQLKDAKTKILHIPTVLGADVPAYNVPGITGEDQVHSGGACGYFSREDSELERSRDHEGQPGGELSRISRLSSSTVRTAVARRSFSPTIFRKSAKTGLARSEREHRLSGRLAWVARATKELPGKFDNCKGRLAMSN